MINMNKKFLTVLVGVLVITTGLYFSYNAVFQETEGEGDFEEVPGETDDQEQADNGVDEVENGEEDQEEYPEDDEDYGGPEQVYQTVTYENEEPFRDQEINLNNVQTVDNHVEIAEDGTAGFFLRGIGISQTYHGEELRVEISNFDEEIHDSYVVIRDSNLQQGDDYEYFEDWRYNLTGGINIVDISEIEGKANFELALQLIRDNEEVESPRLESYEVDIRR